MLPPVLEIYVLWHPGDPAGEKLADELVRHFHGTVFTGLIGGAVEVYVRSSGWRGAEDAPRPIPFPNSPPPNGLSQAMLTAVVPVIDVEFAASVETGHGAWHDYVGDIVTAREESPDRVAVFPLVADVNAGHGTRLGRTLGRFHGIGRGVALTDETAAERWCRDLAQGIAQFLGGTTGTTGTVGAPGGGLTVFISHTTKPGRLEDSAVAELISRVRWIIGQTRLRDFFSTNALQVGQDWEAQLRSQAQSSALLAVRTDLYASRSWCQREMLSAKCAGMPVVVLDAPSQGEERGSFLMDHVPRVPIRRDESGWRDADILRGLNVLVDECLKHALWRHQRDLASPWLDVDVGWWAPHAPEPATLLSWLNRERDAGRLSGNRRVRIVHPDPPLGPDERMVLDQIAAFGGMEHPLDILTPHTLAARGG